MSRRVTIPTQELGDLKTLLIYSEDGIWEAEWQCLQGTRVGDQLTVVPLTIVDHALRGWTYPLVSALGVPPVGALKKLPLASKVCQLRKSCTFYDNLQCFPEAKKLPWCYEPDGFDSVLVSKTTARAIMEWREGVYLIVVKNGE